MKQTICRENAAHIIQCFVRFCHFFFKATIQWVPLRPWIPHPSRKSQSTYFSCLAFAVYLRTHGILVCRVNIPTTVIILQYGTFVGFCISKLRTGITGIILLYYFSEWLLQGSPQQPWRRRQFTISWPYANHCLGQSWRIVHPITHHCHLK